MVAWIIWANINNNEWIAWIVPNVKLMPLIVWDTNWDAWAYNIIKAIEYAIKNWANIINISLWWSQFSYTNVYSEVFKIAHDKGIVIVVAAGNWDELSENSVGVNTTVNKVSPVCDETNKKIVIWVGALWRDWKITPRSNYWDCIDVYAYWEEIYTTTIKTWDTTESWKIPYEWWAWTSFSTPMIAWIIGLWFNIYWKIAPDIVYDALIWSIQSTTVNAAKYLDNLSAAIGELSNAILRMHEKGLTIHSDPSSFKYDNGLRRDEAAKFFVQYARVIMKMKPDYTKEWCSFNDLNEAWDDLQGFVVESCQLWLFKWSNGKFNPASKLTNAQAITVFMRLIGWYLDESGAHYASRYYVNAFNMGLISWTALANRNNFDIEATRGDVALMLYRGAKK